MNRHSQPSSTDAPRRQRGSIVVYLAMALVVFGVMAMAGASRFGASIMGVSSPNCATQARLMAESGVRYAMARLRTATDPASLQAMITTLNGQTYTVDAAKGLKFTLTVTASGTGAAQVSAQGSACGGDTALPTTSTQASASGGVNVPAASGGIPGEGISFAGGDTPGFIPTATIGGGAFTVDPVTGQVTLGGNVKETSGSLWYSGSRDICINGNCTLGTGLRSYFDLSFNPSSDGDGFVWTLMSAETNTNASSGGDSTMGELMGYGGKGKLELGIQPPKFGVEFDIYDNTGTGTACNVGNRADSTNADHVAIIFWGTENLNCGGRPQQATYDDNMHGAGNGTMEQPRNSADTGGNGDGTYGYYYRPGGGNNWLQDGGTYRFRYELLRYTRPTPNGEYYYSVRAWVKRSTDTVTAGLDNTSADYSSTPSLYRNFFLSPAMHAKMGQVFFGWTEGTGAATQLVTLSKFALNFRGAIQWPPKDYTAGWPIDEGSGTTVHNSNATNPVGGTIGGSGTTWVKNPDCPTCIALSFNGSGYVTATDNTSMDLRATGAISVWIYPTALTDNTYILHKGTATSTSGEAYSLRISSGSKLELMIRSGTGTTIIESAALPAANRWYHVVAQWDSNTLAIYINGQLSATTSNNRAARNSSSGLVIGARQTTASPGPTYYGFNGYIDEVYLYKRLLTAAEIALMSLTSMP